jgi:hypothetical protein
MRLVTFVRGNAVALIALFFAVGGVAAAASKYIEVGSPAGGDLTGTYPNPAIAHGAVTADKVAATNKDGLAATPSLRTLGTGSQQAAAGNDPRLSDARAPTGPAGGDLGGTYPNPTFAGAVLDESSPVTLTGGDAARDAEADVSCPQGQHAIAGGGNGGANFVTFYNSEPTTGGQNVGTAGQTATGWRVDAHNPTSTATSIVAYVLCVG